MRALGVEPPPEERPFEIRLSDEAIQYTLQGAAEEPGLIGVTNGEASALARQIYGIQVNGESAVSSVEAFGSRAGGTFRGSGGHLRHPIWRLSLL
jgi:hypothetical protein